MTHQIFTGSGFVPTSDPMHLRWLEASHFGSMLYISGPITTPDPDLKARRKEAFVSAAAELRAAGFSVLCPTELGHIDGAEWGDYLRRDLLAMLAHCDKLAVLSGWESSRGSRLEVAVAGRLGWTVRPVYDWLINSNMPSPGRHRRETSRPGASGG